MENMHHKKCCINCFRDSAIQEIIQSRKTTGDCDFCGSTNVSIYRIESEQNPIADLFIAILGMYGVTDASAGNSLALTLRQDWEIFAIDAKTVRELLQEFCSAVFPVSDPIYTDNVSITSISNPLYLKEVGIVGGKTWSEFSTYIKNVNRFHASMFNADMFARYLSFAEKVYKIGTLMYRARVAQNSEGYVKSKMGAPPPGSRTPGRVNPEGIGMLYLSLDEKTVLHEVRASALDYVTIGTFRLREDLRIVDLSVISDISPLYFIEDLEQYAANRQVFRDIALEVAKPLRRNDHPLEYLPTQFISEFIKSQDYDGVAFDSTLNEGGKNIAVFDEKKLRCTSVKTLEVSKVIYDTVTPRNKK